MIDYFEIEKKLSELEVRICVIESQLNAIITILNHIDLNAFWSTQNEIASIKEKIGRAIEALND